MKIFENNIQSRNFLNEYIKKIQDEKYHPQTLPDALKSRFSAMMFLHDKKIALARAAENFILNTSISKAADLARLKMFSARIKTWNSFEICSAYRKNDLFFIEYRFHASTQENREENWHYHACFQRKNERYFFVSQSEPLIRIIGDPVLHQPGTPFPANPTPEEREKLTWQIEYAKSLLIQAGGAGIAANQCAKIPDPWCFAIVGVFYDNPQHLASVSQRYPGIAFPKARILVNPEIDLCSEESQSFPHACLSLPSSNRCEVKSPREIRVVYQDPVQNMRKTRLTMKATEAVVLWHELMHILQGKTYMDAAFSSLTPAQLQIFEAGIIAEQRHRESQQTFIPDLTLSSFHRSLVINAKGQSVIDENILLRALRGMTDESLAGLLDRCRRSGGMVNPG